MAVAVVVAVAVAVAERPRPAAGTGDIGAGPGEVVVAVELKELRAARFVEGPGLFASEEFVKELELFSPRRLVNGLELSS
mmetsp:Transcript_2675/g.5804  ORF Transcript_2675/g.5804 Transcript_2675/m.5804 type:complete len:80 (-) Transcript_2675:276-515(-)